jgi:hypothetical protein
MWNEPYKVQRFRKEWMSPGLVAVLGANEKAPKKRGPYKKLATV